MSAEWVAIVVAGAALLVTLGQVLFGGGWGLAKQLRDMETRLENKMQIRDDGTTQSLLHLNSKLHASEVAMLKDMQNFVRRDTFQMVLAEIKENHRLNSDKLEGKLDRLIDKLIPKPDA